MAHVHATCSRDSLPSRCQASGRQMDLLAKKLVHGPPRSSIAMTLSASLLDSLRSKRFTQLLPATDFTIPQQPFLNERGGSVLISIGAQGRIVKPSISSSAPPQCRRPIGTDLCERAINRRRSLQSRSPLQPSQKSSRNPHPKDAMCLLLSHHRHPIARGRHHPARSREGVPHRRVRRRAHKEHRSSGRHNGCSPRQKSQALPASWTG